MDWVTTVAHPAVRLGKQRHTPNAEKKVEFLLTESSGKAQHVNWGGVDLPRKWLSSTTNSTILSIVIDKDELNCYYRVQKTGFTNCPWGSTLVCDLV